MPKFREQMPPFDQWLRRGLAEAYAPVLRESLPEELERLLSNVPE